MEDSDGPPPPVSASTLPGQEPEIVQHGHWRGFVGRTKCQSPPIIRVFQRKRERPITAPESTIPRRTRDVPNISECHACGFRVDLSSGKNRLRILYSEWRVVLLCRKCMSLVESLAICSYCFKEVSEGFRCPNCTRRIHNSCFLDYKGCAPCSYSCSGSELSVCIDCWIPKSLARRHPLKRKRRAKKGRPIVCALTYDIVTEVQTAENELISLTKRENGSGAYGTSKNDACTRSIDNAVKQNVLLVGNSPGSKRYKMAAQDCAEMAVDDAELAFRLHRSMNSSPRISKILRVDKMSCMVYNRRMKKHTAEESRRTSESGNLSISGMALVRSNEGSLGNLDKNNSENPRALCHDFSANEHYYQASRVADQGSSQEDCACVFKCNEEEGNLHVQIKEGTGCSLNDMGHAFPTCSKYDDSVKLMNVGNVVNKDQYRLTYYKKRSNSDKGSRCKNLYDRINFENGMISACSNDGSLENLDKNNSGYYMASSHDSSANVQLTEANRLPDQGCTQGDTLCPVKCSQVVGSLHAPIKEGEGSYLNSMGPKFLTCLKYDYHVKPTDVGNVGKKDQILLTLDKGKRCENVYDRINFENPRTLPCSNEGSVSNIDKNNSEYYMTACHDSSANVQLTGANIGDDQELGQGCACLNKCSEEEAPYEPIREGEGCSASSMGPEFLACSKLDDSVKPVNVGYVGKKDQCHITHCKKKVKFKKGRYWLKYCKKKVKFRRR